MNVWKWNVQLEHILQLHLRFPLTSVGDLWPHQHVWLSVINLWLKFGSNWWMFEKGMDIWSIFYNLTSDDLWPHTVTFDLVNKSDFSWFIYDPSLVPIGYTVLTGDHFIKTLTKMSHTYIRTDVHTYTRKVWFLGLFPELVQARQKELSLLHDSYLFWRMDCLACVVRQGRSNTVYKI